MRKFSRFFSILIGILCPFASVAQSNFYAIDTIQVIDITFSQSNWDYQMDTAKAGSDGYILATQVLVNGIVYDSVGVKFKGNSSYDSARAKNPLHIKLDYVHSSYNYLGHEDVKLGNGFSDPSSVREVLAYEILQNYMAAPECNFARVTINGTYYGLFSSAESIDKDFLSTHFYSSDNSFFKCNPENVLSGQVPNLLYLGTDSANYYTRYEIKSDYAWKDLIDLCDTLANFPGYLDTLLDIDRAIWMIAFNNVTVNLDSYSGAFAQNYYLYKDDNDRFNPIVWDLNMCFGGFTNTGTSNLNISGMQQMTPTLHSSYGARPLIVKLLADPLYKNMYIAHMRTINNEFFVNGAYVTLAQDLQTLVDSSVSVETNSFYSYSQFQNGITTSVGTIPGISTLMGTRTTYLASTTEFQQTPPTISTIATSPSVVALNDTIWVTASVTNGTTVYLGYRDQIYHKFIRTSMFDDGLHNDGAAGDNVYGAYMIAASALMQYYIYAENANAGMFSPERAEYEFYSVLVAVSVPAVGEVVINEFLASNLADTADENGAYEDWIELYNRTAIPLNLNGLYLTDDYTNPTKFALPDLILAPNTYLIIWADENSSSLSSVHCNFKLSASGEQLMLSTAGGTVIDSVTFGLQDPDISYGRCPNGYGNFTYFSPTTCNAMNTCPASVEENVSDNYSVSAYPNPANGLFTIVSNHPDAYAVVLYNASGQILQNENFSNDKAVMNAEELAVGIYFYQVKDREGNVVQVGKMVVGY